MEVAIKAGESNFFLNNATYVRHFAAFLFYFTSILTTQKHTLNCMVPTKQVNGNCNERLVNEAVTLHFPFFPCNHTVTVFTDCNLLKHITTHSILSHYNESDQLS